MIFLWHKGNRGFWAVTLFFPHHFEITAFRDDNTKVFQSPLYSSLEHPLPLVPWKGL